MLCLSAITPVAGLASLSGLPYLESLLERVSTYHADLCPLELPHNAPLVLIVPSWGTEPPPAQDKPTVPWVHSAAGCLLTLSNIFLSPLWTAHVLLAFPTNLNMIHLGLEPSGSFQNSAYPWAIFFLIFISFKVYS